MLRKASFLCITGFWLVMNGLLWRAEFGGKGEGGTYAPVSLVWEKILSSPDDSGLAVQIGKDRVGYLRWAPNIGEEIATGKTGNENSDIEGRVRKLTGYTIHSDGNFILPEQAMRFRFEFDAKFGPDHRWTEWRFKGIQRPNAWTIAADRKSEMFEISLGEGASQLKQRFRFADFRQPEKLLGELGAVGAPGFAELLPTLGIAGTNAPLSFDLNWEASQEWLQMGHSKTRIYRLRAHLLDKYEAVILVSRVGEILRVELPAGVALVNEALITLQ
jgi:hypothetical protein